MKQYFAVALISFIAGFWFAGLDLYGHNKSKAKKDPSQEPRSMGFSFDSEGRPLDE